MYRTDLVILEAFSCLLVYSKECFPGYNDWGRRGCHKLVPVLGGNGSKIAPPGDLFDQPPGELS